MSTKRQLTIGAVAVFLLVAALFIPTLRGGFVYDSIAQVLHSDYIHTPSNWGDVLTLSVVGQDELDRNRPMHLASLMLDAAIWGKNPLGYRLTSVLLHALNAALLFLFLTIALRPRTTPVAAASSPPVVAFFAVFGALFFALHPLVVEAVAEPSNREDLLVLLPMLLGLLAVAAPIRSPWVLNAALVLCGFSAVLAKESGIAVPMVFAVAAWWCGSFRRLLPGLVGGLVVATGFLVASYLWRPAGSAILVQSPAGLSADFWSLLSVQSRIWTLQFSQIVWPWNLCAQYPPESLSAINSPVALAVIVVVLAAAAFIWRADRLAALGVAVYALCLLPASNFAAQYHPIADRYLYVPLAGLGMIAAALTRRLRIMHPSGLAGVLLVTALLILLSLEYVANLRRQLIWQQPKTLWSDALQQYPSLPQALLGIANVHYRTGNFQAARAAATEAVMASNARWSEAWALRAVCEWQAGGHEQALESLRHAQRLSRIYINENSVAETMVFSPEQLAVLSDLLRAAKD